MCNAKIEFDCPECDKTVAFPISDIGTVQECEHCGGYVDVPNGSDEMLPNVTTFDRQSEEYDRQSEESRRQLEVSRLQEEEYGRQLEFAAKLQKQQSNLIERGYQTADNIDSLLAKCNSLAKRFDKYLTSLEQENKQG